MRFAAALAVDKHCLECSSAHSFAPGCYNFAPDCHNSRRRSDLDPFRAALEDKIPHCCLDR